MIYVPLRLVKNMATWNGVSKVSIQNNTKIGCPGYEMFVLHGIPGHEIPVHVHWLQEW